MAIGVISTNKRAEIYMAYKIDFDVYLTFKYDNFEMYLKI